MDFFRDFVPRSARLPTPDPFKRARGTLVVGDNLFSATRLFMLTMQSDGNLVLYALDNDTLAADATRGKYTVALWESGTNGLGGTHCDMQDDGNCVVKNSANEPLWCSGTPKSPRHIFKVSRRREYCFLCSGRKRNLSYKHRRRQVWFRRKKLRSPAGSLSPSG